MPASGITFGAVEGQGVEILIRVMDCFNRPLASAALLSAFKDSLTLRFLKGVQVGDTQLNHRFQIYDVEEGILDCAFSTQGASTF